MRFTVDIVTRRDPRRCVHCGITETLTVQHRARVGMGGRASAHVWSNVILMCAVSNAACESDAAFAALARRNGWKVSAYLATDAVAFWDGPGAAWIVIDNMGGRRAARTDELPTERGT